jgi:hypothetical protein
VAGGGPDIPNCSRCVKRDTDKGGNGRCKVPRSVRAMWGGADLSRDHACGYYSYGTSKKKPVEAPQEALF